MCPWSTEAVISSTSIFVAIANNTLYGQNYNFSVMTIIHVPRRTTLKMIFSIFRCFWHPQIPDFFKYSPNHTSMEILFIQLSDDT